MTCSTQCSTTSYGARNKETESSVVGMANEVTIDVYGVKSTLEYLRRFEPAAYKQVTTNIRNVAEPVRAAVAQTFPASSGLRNWDRYGHLTKQKQKTTRGPSGYTFPRYKITQVRKGVKTQVGGRKIRSTNTYPILRIKQTDGAGQIFDLAAEGHSSSGQAFVGKIAGKASRVMWPTVKKKMPLITNDITKTMREVEKQFTAEIAVDMDRRAKLSNAAKRQVRDALGKFTGLVR